MKNLGTHNSFLFYEHILISLDKKWIEIFGELPKFEVKIDKKGKLHIISTKSIKSSLLESPYYEDLIQNILNQQWFL